MRYWIILCVSFVLPLTLSAQRGGHGGGGGSRGGGGGVSHGSAGGGFSRGGSTVGHAGGIGRGGGSVGFGGYDRGGWNRGGYGYGRGWYGRGYGLGFYGGYYGYPGLYRWGYYPYGYDYSSGYYDYGYSSPSYYSAPGYDSGYATPINDTYQPPTVVVNQAYRYPSESQAPPPPPREFATRPNDAVDYTPTLYLIALRDHNIRPALTYWVERGALHYVTMEHEMREIPLASIDRDLSVRLNRERNMNFRLPAS